MKTNPRWEKRTLTEELLVRGVDDWIHVAEFVYVARNTHLDNPEALRAVALGLMTALLTRELIIPGDVDDFGFQPWVTNLGESIRRIVETWDENDLSPTPGSVGWFALTEEGERRGRAIIASEEAADET